MKKHFINAFFVARVKHIIHFFLAKENILFTPVFGHRKHFIRPSFDYRKYFINASPLR